MIRFIKWLVKAYIAEIRRSFKRFVAMIGLFFVIGVVTGIVEDLKRKSINKEQNTINNNKVVVTEARPESLTEALRQQRELEDAAAKCPCGSGRNVMFGFDGCKVCYG